VSKDVDIISMSFALEKNNRDLERAVLAAKGEGIVIICSTADRGNNQPKVYPADCGEDKDTIKIAACDEMGYPAQYASGAAHYYFQGENIVTDILNSTSTVSGSSVATALAAGVASLILACGRLDKDGVSNEERNKRVRTWFDKMQGEGTNSKYVRPWIKFGEAERGDGNFRLLPRLEDNT